MRGDRPTPTAFKVLAGNPGKRPLNDAEPDSPVLVANPEPPVWLSDDARQFWDECCSTLVPMGHVTEADRPALALLAMAMAELKEANDKLAEEGHTVSCGQFGDSVKANPYVAVKNAAMQQIKSLLVEFGMTPSSRSRVKKPAESGGNRLSDFLNGHKKSA